MTASGYSVEPARQGELRSLVEIEDRLRWLSRVTNDPPPGYDDEALEEMRGAASALAWVLGEVTPAPVTGEVVIQPPSRNAVVAERHIAERVALPNAYPDYRPPEAALRHSDDYVFGVRDALVWVLGETTS